MAEYFKPDPSIFEQSKAESLAFRQAEKVDKLLTPQPDRLLLPEQSQGYLADLVDLGQSSFYNELGLASDAASNTSNYLLGTQFDSSENDGFSNKASADAFAGVSDKARQSLDQGQNQVLVDIANRDYGKAALSALNVAGETAADSLGSILGLGAGALLTDGVGAAVGAKRKFDNLKGAFDKVKGMRKVLDAGGKVTNALAKTSLINITETQRKVHSYQQENNGQLPTAGRVAVMGLGSAITDTAELGVIKKFFLPGSKQVKELKSLVRTLNPDKSAIKSIATRISEGLTKLAAAGTAEGVQEYLQTWDEILSVKVNPKDGQTMFQAVMDEVNKQSNKDEALTGGFLGAAAGGATKSVGVVPAVGVGSAVDASVGTTKTAYKTARAVYKYGANRSARNKLSPEDARDLNKQYQTEKQIVDNKTNLLKEQRKKVSKARTFEDLTSDDQIEPLVSAIKSKLKMSDQDAAKPENLKQIKKAVISLQTRDIKSINKALDSSNLSSFKNRSGRPNKKASNVTTEEQTDTLADSVSSQGDQVIQAAQELESSGAVDLVKEINKNPDQVSDKVLSNAKQLSTHDLERIAAITKDTNPETAKEISKLAKSKNRAIRRFVPSKNKVITKGILDPDIKKISKSGILSNSHIPYISSALSNTLNRKLGDLETVKTLQSALSAYEKHPRVLKQGKGVAHKNTIAKWRKRLDAAELRLTVKDEGTKETSTNTKEKSTDKVPETKGAKESSNTASSSTESTSEDIKPTTSDKIKNLSAGISLSIKNNVDLAPIRSQMPKIVSKLAKEGYDNKESFNQLIKEFPGLSEDPEILNALKLGLLNPVIQEPSTATKTLNTQQIDEAYLKLFPGCKI